MTRQLMAIIANAAMGSKGNHRGKDMWPLPWDSLDTTSTREYTPEEITDIYNERQEIMKTGNKTIVKDIDAYAT